MHYIKSWVMTHWLLDSFLLGVALALIVLLSGAGGVGAGIAATIWAGCIAVFYTISRSMLEDSRELRNRRAAFEERLLRNGRAVRDCLRELADQFNTLVSVLETTAPLDWGSQERAQFSQRFADFVLTRGIITRLPDAIFELQRSRDKVEGEPARRYESSFQLDTRHWEQIK
jgi:hypothetical protein